MKLTFRDAKLFSFFILNGGILGLVAYFIQNYIYQNMIQVSEFKNFVSAFLAMIPILFLNFIIQLKIIFKTKGRFAKFLAANLFVLTLISIFTEISFRLFPIRILYNDYYYNLNFILVSLLMMPLSFLLKRNFVFIGDVAE